MVFREEGEKSHSPQCIGREYAWHYLYNPFFYVNLSNSPRLLFAIILSHLMLHNFISQYDHVRKKFDVGIL